MTESQRIWQTVTGLLLLCFLLYFWELGHIPFYSYEESKEALIVWEIVNGGGWVLPLRNGIEMPLKPPLFHWCGAVIALLSGQVNEFAVRSPSAFSAAGAVLLTFFFGHTLWNWRVGLLSSLILATSPQWTRWAITARSDMLMVFFLTAAGVTFFQVWQQDAKHRNMLVLFYVSVGLATLAKGPLGLLLPTLTVVGFLGVQRQLHFFRRMRLIEGTVIVLLIAASWYVLATWQGGSEFFRRQVLNENIFRFFDNPQGGPSRDHNLFYYLPTLCVGMLPWSLFFPALLDFLYRSRAEWGEKKLLYPLVWFATGFIFFSLASGKRSNYLLPLYPAVALLLGVWWNELIEGSTASAPGVKRFARVCAVILCAAFAVIVAVLVAHSAGFDLEHWVAPLLHPRDRANIPLIAQGLQNQVHIVLVWLLMLALATGWYFWGLQRDQWMFVFAALTVAVSSSLYFTNALLHPLLAWERSYRIFMRGVSATVKDAPLYFYQDAYDYGANFYADRHVPSYTGDLANLIPGNEDSQPRYLLMREQDWQALSATTTPRLEALGTSEGKGPDKKYRLVLVAVLRGRDAAH